MLFPPILQGRVADSRSFSYFVSRELGVALMLQRSFDWSSNLLFPHSIPNLQSPYHSAFYLAGRDSILNAERIRRCAASVQPTPRAFR